MAQSSHRTTSLKLDPELRNRIQRLADTRRRSPHWVMREAIAEYVAREELRAQFQAEAEAAWAEFQSTGLHLTGEEADSWLARLETDEDPDLPTCHR